MRRIFTLSSAIALPVVAALALAACGGGVDRDGTRDMIVEQIEASGVAVDSDCIDDALGEYSDDELTTIDEALSNDAAPEGEALALVEQMMTCVDLGG